jgi:hypothetical protein
MPPPPPAPPRPPVELAVAAPPPPTLALCDEDALALADDESTDDAVEVLVVATQEQGPNRPVSSHTWTPSASPSGHAHACWLPATQVGEPDAAPPPPPSELVQATRQSAAVATIVAREDRLSRRSG